MSFDPQLAAALAIFAFVSSVTPGPNNLMLLASGANYGLARSLPHMLGVVLGFALMIVLVGLGLMQLFTLYPGLEVALRIASVAYLLWLAWKIAQAAQAAGDGPDRATGRPFTFFQAAAFQWVNPKAWAMALTAISAYAPARDIGAVIWVASVFQAVGLPCLLGWTALGVQLRRLLSDPLRLRRFNWAMAALLVLSLFPVLRS